MELPEWMVRMPSSVPGGPTGKQNRYLARSLRELSRLLLDNLISERLARQKGWWQGLNPALKLVSALGLIIMVSLARNLGFLVFIWLFTLLAMAGSRLPVLSLQKKVWGVIPLITLIISLPAALNLVTPGDPWLWITHGTLVPGRGINLPPLYLTCAGVKAVFFLCMRVGLSLSLATLLVFTTPISQLLRSLRVLRVPVLLVMIIEMTYRYIIVLVECSLEMMEARQMRTVGQLSTRRQAMLVASSVGSLFGRSMALADETYMAMTARGYTGEARVLSTPGIRPGDGGWVVLMTAIIVISIAGGFWLG